MHARRHLAVQMLPLELLGICFFTFSENTPSVPDLEGEKGVVRVYKCPVHFLARCVTVKQPSLG